MKAQINTTYKLLLSVSLVLFMVGCGTSGPKESSITKKRTGSVSDIGQKELAGDLEERLKRSRYYTQNNTLLSSLNKSSVKEKCEFNAQKDYKDWGKMLRVGFACVNKNDWKTVDLIGRTFNTRHIDAPWGAYFLSLVSEKAGDMPGALWMIGLADRKSPDNAVIEFQKARLLWLQGQKDAAFQSAKKALKQDPKLTEAAMLMAQVYFSDYEFENAQTYYRKVIDADDKMFTAVLGMAESFAQLDKYKESIPFYIRAIKIKKNRIDLAYVLADIYETKVKDYRRALDWYEKISGVFPKEIISKEKTEVLNKIALLTTKIEEQKNAGKSQQAKKSDSKRTPASAAAEKNPDDDAQLDMNADSDEAQQGGQ
jgi:tetratricopeptide (TPR) repeat protein